MYSLIKEANDTNVTVLNDIKITPSDNESKFYQKILEEGPPEGMLWHPNYIEALKMNAYGIMHVCYDGPIYLDNHISTL